MGVSVTSSSSPTVSVTVEGKTVTVSRVGAQGPRGSVWREGSGAPDDSLGVNGDFYHDRDSGDVYQKEGGTWGTPYANITGPQGADVLTGTGGNEVPTNADIDGRGFAAQVDSVSALRSTSFPASLDRIWLSGDSGDGTPGAGEFYRSSDTTSDDDGATVIIDAGGVRWKRSLPYAQAPNRGGPRVAVCFDDGYRSNFNLGFHLFQKRGFAATVFMEIEDINRSGTLTGKDGLTIEQIRTMIDAGWEVTNHPDLTLTDTDEQMYTDAKAENDLLVDLLTGEKEQDSDGNVTTGSLSHPRFKSYRPTTTAYRGGSRNDKADKAYRVLFDKVRTIPGTIATRGDHLGIFALGDERTQMTSAQSIDTSNVSLEQAKGWVSSALQAGNDIVLYAHDILPVGTSTSGANPPALNQDELDEILDVCDRYGATVVPYKDLHVGNVVPDSGFDNTGSGSFSARSGDTAEWDETVALYDKPRSAHLISSAQVANLNTAFTTDGFTVSPLHWYRVRIIYRIDSPLSVPSGAAGLMVRLKTNEGNTAQGSTGSDDNRRVWRNDTGKALPAAATSGWEEYETVVASGPGTLGTVGIGLFQATGEVWIGHIAVERLTSLSAHPPSGEDPLNTSIGQRIYLPDIADGGSSQNHRSVEWEFEAYIDPITLGETVEYAFEDQSDVPALNAGDRVYVLGDGVGTDFSGKGGQIATWDGSVFSFAQPAARTLIRVSANAEGISNRYFFHLPPRAISGTPTGKARYIETFSERFHTKPQIERIDDNKFEVYDPLGSRTDTFRWWAKLRGIDSGTSGTG